MFRVVPAFVTRTTRTVLHVILNECTMTVHKHESGSSDLHTVCGVTHHVSHDQLREVPVERAASDDSATKCGRCFEEGGSY